MIGPLNALTWCTKKTYLAPYAEDEAAKKAATKLWNTIDGCTIPLIIGMIILTIGVAYLYFYPFNNRPGKHYQPKFWIGFGIIAFVATPFVTFSFCYFYAKNPSFDYTLLFKVSAINALYSIPVYIVTTFFLNRFSKSNAYPIF